MGQTAKPIRANRTITIDFHEESTYAALLGNTKALVECVFAFILSLGFQLTHKSTCSSGGCLTRHSHDVRVRLRALNAGKCGVEMEGGRLPTADWMLNLHILTSGGLR